jgi:hypothetical protein
MVALNQAFAGPIFPSKYYWGRKGAGSDLLAGGSSMPRISDWMLDAVAFLYRSEEEARRRAKIGGCAFIVSRKIPDSERVTGGRALYIPYLVSNRHVVFGGGASVVSINRRDGGAPDIFPLEPTDWVEHPRGDDVAVTCIYGLADSAVHKTSHISADTLLIPEAITHLQIGVGDEVFMAGRFINHQGRETNRPAARFGSISMGLEKIWVAADNRWQDSFAVEMRSRTGFSGAPVAVYRTRATVISRDIPPEKQEFWGLLGVNWGYILDEDGENTWLNGVVPAWKILETLGSPPLKDRQKKFEEDFHRRFAKGDKGAQQAFATEPDSAAPVAPAKDANPQHREDFTALVGEAARKRPQGGKT